MIETHLATAYDVHVDQGENIIYCYYWKGGMKSMRIKYSSVEFVIITSNFT